jgi:hypothetical protein
MDGGKGGGEDVTTMARAVTEDVTCDCDCVYV